MRSLGKGRPLFYLYRTVFSPALHLLTGAGMGCRFEPTCSRYFAEALNVHGWVHGALFGMKRLGRCQPWGGAGLDPVPPRTQIGKGE